MKQLKKMMLVMTLALCALGLTACRTNSNDNTTNTTENGNATGNTSATETNGATDNTTGTTGETLTNETGEDTVGTGAGTGSDGQNDAGTAPYYKGKHLIGSGLVSEGQSIIILAGTMAACRQTWWVEQRFYILI